MADLFWLTGTQMRRLEPFFPKSRGRARVDDRRVLSGIIFVNRNGLRWRDAPTAYGPPKTLYNRWLRWSRMGVFARMLIELAAQGQQTATVMIYRYVCAGPVLSATTFAPPSSYAYEDETAPQGYSRPWIAFYRPALHSSGDTINVARLRAKASATRPNEQLRLEPIRAVLSDSASAGHGINRPCSGKEEQSCRSLVSGYLSSPIRSCSLPVPPQASEQHSP